MGHTFSFNKDHLTFFQQSLQSSLSVIRKPFVTTTTNMAPVPGSPMEQVENYISKNKVMVFSKTTCPFCTKIKQLFDSLKFKYEVLELDQISDGAEIQAALAEKSGQRTVPNVYINGEHVGGCDDTLKLHSENKLLSMVQKGAHNYDYDIIIIGGGSGKLKMVRSILLRGFDQQMANKIGEYMEEHGVNMVRECVPTSIEKIEAGWSIRGAD